MRRVVADAQDKVKMFSVKVHRVGGEVLVACCDDELLDKKLSEGDINIHISRRFYGGEKVDADGLSKALTEATVANLMGDAVVGLAIEKGLVEESGVVEVCGIKHAQLFVMQ
jgi:uncharacterized protein